MERSAWLGKLEDLQDRHRRGEPLGEDTGWYTNSRAILVATALAEQAKRLSHHERARRHLRIHQAMPVTLSCGDWSASSMTTDLAAGGFACWLDGTPPGGGPIRASLRLPDAPVEERVSVVNVGPPGDGVRVSFTFDHASAATRDRIETFLLEAVVEQLVFWDDVLNTMGIR